MGEWEQEPDSGAEDSSPAAAGPPVPSSAPFSYAPIPAMPHAPSLAARLRALLEVLACSGVPTQLAIGQSLALAGVSPMTGQHELNVQWVFWVALLDTLAVIALTIGFLRANGESPRAVILGPRHPIRESGLGLLLVVPVLLMAGGVMLLAQKFVPDLHNVLENPLAALLKSPRDAWLFVVVALVGGGIREEVQRAFLITRFAGYLGGARVGLVVTSVAFGLGHVLQGWDAALATGVLGFLWGTMYLWRRGAVASMASHAGFNGLEIARFLVFG
jgi:membrane protease YdiL (CAAX protease family)